MKKDQWQIDKIDAINKKAKKEVRSYPDWYLDNEPVTNPQHPDYNPDFENLYMTYVSYWEDCSSERRFESGAIPRSVIKGHAGELGFGKTETIVHANIINSLDQAYKEWQKAMSEQKKAIGQGAVDHKVIEK